MAPLESSLMGIVDALGWRDRSAFTECALLSEYSAFLRAAFDELLARAATFEVGGVARVQAAVARVQAGDGPASLERILFSPTVSATLRDLRSQAFPRPLVEQAIEAVAAWLAVELGEAPGDSIWGGFRVLPDLSRPPSALLGDRLPVDFDSPIVWQRQETGDRVVEVLGDAERPRALARLERAVHILRAVSPVAAEFMLRHTFVVQVRSMGDRASVASVSTWPRNGATVLHNVLGDGSTPELLAECLLHEAIHHCLYQYELVRQPFHCSERGCREPSNAVMSPWSKQRIPSDSFVHACFVWFGLWNFWRRAAGSSISTQTSRIARRQGNLSASGFLSRPDLAALTRPAGFVCPEFLHRAIEAMRQTVCGEELTAA